MKTPSAVLSRRLSLASLGFALLLAAVLLALPVHAQGVKTGQSGLPVPRFVSLKSDAVNVRRGPSREHDIVWRYVRAGLPVEVTQEFDNWRRIRDFEGAEGWVFHSLLSGTRTALVAPWDKSDAPIALYADADRSARITAKVEPGVQAVVEECTGLWCQLKGVGFSGWIEQPSLWGVYPDEVFD
ncbi:MAG: SH3 domain-containing protein [Phenylobacterium sp.]|nr:SH3 domain-containing protein [Phenylobacterium sp.]